MSTNTPLELNPAQVTPNFDNPEDCAYQALITAGICIPVILAFAGTKLYVKRYMLKSHGRDDWAHIFGLLVGLTYIALVVGLARGGVFGKHVWDVRRDEAAAKQLRLFAVIDILYQPLVWFIKLPLFLMLLSIFGRLRWMRFWAWGGLIATMLFALGALSVEIQFCAPPSDTDDVDDLLSVVSSAGCVQNQSPSYHMAAINLATDIFILVLPIPAIWSLQLPIRKKLGIWAIFLTGLGACSSNAVELSQKAVVDDNNIGDFTWNMVALLTASMIEMTLGLLIPCMPACATLYRRVKPLVVSRLAHYNSKIRSRHERDSQIFIRSVPNPRTPGRRDQGWYKEIDEPQPALAYRASDMTESGLGDQGPSEIGMNRILKTTELVIRSSSTEEVNRLQARAPGW